MCVMCVMCVIKVNKIGDEGTKSLSQCLTHLTQLTYLNLSGECCALILYLVWCVMICKMCESVDNKIEDEGAKALSQCIPHLAQLTHLDLSRECVHIVSLVCVMCDVTLLWCDVMRFVWVQGTGLEMREQVHWDSACHLYSFVCDALVVSVNFVEMIPNKTQGNK